MSHLEECDVFVRILYMPVINMKREKNKDQQSCLLGFPILLFILCQLDVFLSRLQDVKFYGIGPDHCLVIYFAQIGTILRTQVHKI